MSDHEVSEADLRAMAQAVRQHLDPADALFVGQTAMRFPKRFAALMSAYGGQRVTGEEFARLNLRVCKLIVETGGAS